MRKLYLTAIVLCAAFTGVAQEKIDFVGQSALHQYRLNQQSKNTTETLKPVMAGVNAGNETTAVIVDLSEGYDIEDLIGIGRKHLNVIQSQEVGNCILLLVGYI